jgi:hypothetical protein
MNVPATPARTLQTPSGRGLDRGQTLAEVLRSPAGDAEDEAARESAQGHVP